MHTCMWPHLLVCIQETILSVFMLVGLNEDKPRAGLQVHVQFIMCQAEVDVWPAGGCGGAA